MANKILLDGKFSVFYERFVGCHIDHTTQPPNDCPYHIKLFATVLEMSMECFCPIQMALLLMSLFSIGRKTSFID